MELVTNVAFRMTILIFVFSKGVTVEGVVPSQVPISQFGSQHSTGSLLIFLQPNSRITANRLIIMVINALFFILMWCF